GDARGRHRARLGATRRAGQAPRVRADQGARVPAAQERRVSRLAPADTPSGKEAQRLRQWPSDRYLDERPTAVGVDGEGTVAREEGGDLLLDRDRERRRDAELDV